MQYYDKNEIKEKLTTDMVSDIVYEFGGEPKATSFGFISATICHNVAGEGSHKLYYYENTRLFRCYTGCDSTFDIFELIQKVKLLSRPNCNWTLFDSMRWVCLRYNWTPSSKEDDEIALPDWAILDRYNKFVPDENLAAQIIQLKEYDESILTRLSYPKISSWLAEGISQEILDKNKIGYYPGGEQITIPHYDARGRFIGLRGRAISKDNADKYGKYRPIFINGTLYNHPLGLNLYNLNNSKDNIGLARKAIVVEGEKSCLKSASYFGVDNDISVACCGSAISFVQIKLLLEAGASEIIIGFDKQFQEIGDAEFKHLVKNLKNIHKKYSPYATISFLFDKWNLLGYKDSPLDRGPEVFKQLYKQRIFL